jgi:DNA-binding CsgD family transcriptional regulator/extradiol dioxygenase family protein
VSANSRRGRPPHADLLTPAEWRTVHAVQHGLSNRDIARRRGISTDAVKFHIANALAKLALPDRKSLRRWFRAPADSALARSNRPMSDLQLGAVAQISRSVRDMKEAEAFYGQTLGLKHLYSFGTLAFFDLAGTRLYLQQQEPTPESILYLRVADIAAAFEQLSARGVHFSSAPHLIHRHADGTEEWLATFTDPEGRPLMLMSQVPPR